MLVYEIYKAFESFKVPYVLVGGYALAFHNIVRATMNVDLVIKLDLESLEKAEAALKSINLQSRVPIRAQDVFKFRKEYIEKRNMIAWSFVDYKDPGRQVDLLITLEIKDIKVDKISVAGIKIPVASLADLLKMKKISGRPQDLIDIVSIENKIEEKKNDKK